VVVIKALNVLRLGYELRDPAKWKRGQNLTNAIGGVIGFVVFALRQQYPDILIPDGFTEYLVEGIAAVLMAVNLYFVPATTQKIGL
jgi:hypothetical protein